MRLGTQKIQESKDKYNRTPAIIFYDVEKNSKTQK